MFERSGTAWVYAGGAYTGDEALTVMGVAKVRTASDSMSATRKSTNSSSSLPSSIFSCSKHNSKHANYQKGFLAPVAKPSQRSRGNYFRLSRCPALAALHAAETITKPYEFTTHQ